MSEEEISLSFKLGMAAAILASVGTFAVAEGQGEGEGGCGDGICAVGTVVQISDDLTFVGHSENTENSWSGIIYGRTQVTGKTTQDEEAPGNCSGIAGDSGTNGCNN